MLSAKNAMISPSAASLGLGDDLRQQVEDELEARKKKLADSQATGGLSAQLLLGGIPGSGR